MEGTFSLDVLMFKILPFQYLTNGVTKQMMSLEFNLEKIIKMPHTYLVMMALN